MQQDGTMFADGMEHLHIIGYTNIAYRKKTIKYECACFDLLLPVPKSSPLALRLQFELQQLRRQVRKLTRCVGLLQRSPQYLHGGRVFRVPRVTCDEFLADVHALYS